MTHKMSQQIFINQVISDDHKRDISKHYIGRLQKKERAKKLFNFINTEYIFMKETLHTLIYYLYELRRGNSDFLWLYKNLLDHLHVKIAHSH